MKKAIDQKLPAFLKRISKRYALEETCPLLRRSIEEFVLRDGKRLRPLLFLTAYKGYAESLAPQLMETALSIELVHNFMLIHDDIIDRSKQRRFQKSLHVALQEELSSLKNIKFQGTDLAIIIGDIIYSLSIEAFLSIQENPARKEAALKEFIKTASLTGIGQFIELMAGATPLEKITPKEIYRIYDYKTAQYSFTAPLKTGAILAGAPQKEIKLLSQLGKNLGIAFQIKDDILGVFADPKNTGKSILSDIQEAKRTLLVYFAYKESNDPIKKHINAIFNKPKVPISDIQFIKQIMLKSGTYDYTVSEMKKHARRALALIDQCQMKSKQKKLLYDYALQMQTVNGLPLLP